MPGIKHQRCSRTADLTTFAGRLLNERRKLGITQQELADRINSTRVTIANWESLGGNYPQKTKLLRLSKFLGVDPSYLLYGDGVANSNPNNVTGTPFERAMISVREVRWSPHEAAALKALIDVSTN